MKISNIYESLPYIERSRVMIDGIYFDTKDLDFKALFDHSLLISFEHILKYVPECVGAGEQRLRYNCIFYSTPRGIVLVTNNIGGYVLNTKIRYVRGSRLTPKNVVYFCPYEDIKVARSPRIGFIGQRATYGMKEFMRIYNKKLERARVLYKKCASGLYLPETPGEQRRLQRADTYTGVYVDDNDVIRFICLNVYGRYHYKEIVPIVKISEYL